MRQITRSEAGAAESTVVTTQSLLTESRHTARCQSSSVICHCDTLHGRRMSVLCGSRCGARNMWKHAAERSDSELSASISELPVGQLDHFVGAHSHTMMIG